MDALLDGLNPAQKQAVTSPASVLQVLAPPGSGKTKTLTARVAYHVCHDDFKPWNVLVCTFTIKAAREMQERICTTLTEKQASKLILGTFHSVARRYLVNYGQNIGISKNFGIADTSDTTNILKRIIKRQSYGIEPRDARSRISSNKSRDISSEQAAAKSKSPDQQEFSAVFAEYEETLRTSNLLDYDDLLLRCRDLLRRYPQCVSNIEAVLIDEFQDTNNVQYDLMCLFAQHQRRITIVGDPDQSIYGFRAAEIKNLGRMTAQYPDTVTIHLEENYRSAGSILACALTVIEQDKSRPAKNLLATHCRGERPVFRKLPSAQAEAKWLAGEIKRCHALTGGLVQHDDFAILLRSATLSLPMERALSQAGIPYRMLAGHKFFDRHEIKVILDYLRVINQPEHNDALIRVINVPSRKIGEITYKSLLAEAEQRQVSLWSLILDASQGRRKPSTKISKPAQVGLDKFVDIILTSRSKLANLDNQDTTLFDLVMHVVKKLAFDTYLKAQYPEDHADRWQNVQELVAQATDMTRPLDSTSEYDEESLPQIDGVEQRATNTVADTLARYLTNVALATEVEKQGDGNVAQVTISTIHSAKGLEWPIVFIPGAYEGSIPHSRSEDTDEERRLLYVGMTRAQALLYLSYPFKNSQRQETTISHFLASVDGMADKGSVFDFGVVRDLARILRRTCPPDDVVLKGRTLVEHPEDDLWPTEITEPNDPYWEALANGNPDAATARWRPAGHFIPIEARGVSVSMQQTASFSVSSTTIPSSGFVSAGTLTRNEPRFSEVRRLGKSDEHSEPRQPPLKKQKSGQGSIKSFFGKPEAANPTAAVTTTALSNDRVYPPHSRPLPLSHDISNTVGFKPVSRSSDLKAEPASVRKLLKKPLHSKPRRATPPAEETREQYILLSSSPARPDREERAISISSDKAPGDDEDDSGFRPVSTMHATSMARVATATATRRTLGVKRTFNGWSNRMAREQH